MLHCIAFSFFLIRPCCAFLDYTVEKKNHTTVTTVIPKIGKLSHLPSLWADQLISKKKKILFIQFQASSSRFSMFLTNCFLLSRRPRCGSFSPFGNTVDQPVPDPLRRLLFLPQTLQPTPEHLLPPQQG